MSPRRLKSRPALSCTRCRERKVKCDRVKPCQACCVHGQPRECVYDEDGEDRLAIAQAHEIQSLRAEVSSLRKKLETSHIDSDSPRKLSSSSASTNDGSSPSSTTLVDDLRPSKNTQLVATRHSAAENYYMSIQTVQPSATLNLLWANFMDQFIDKLSPRSMPGASDWIRSLAQVTSGSELLSDAFCVASFFHCGVARGNRTLEIEGRRMYGKVLKDLQIQLYDRERSARPEVFYTLLILIIHEILYFQHPMAWLAHISGAEKLLEMRLPYDFYQGLERETFLHFRMFNLSLNILRRKKTFLSLSPWKTRQWQSYDTPQSIIEALVDEMVDLPGIFADADVLAAKLASGSVPPDEASRLTNEFWACLGDFEERMRIWTETWIDPWPGLHCRPVNQGDPQCVSDVDHFNRSLWYADDHIARAICLYAAGRLLLSRVDRRPHRPSDATIEQLSMLICDSTNYLLAVTHDYVSALNMLFPLRVAYFSLSESSVGRIWIQDVLWHISTRFDMSFAVQFTTTLPGRGGQIELA